MDTLNIGKKIDEIEVKISHRIIELFSAGLYSSANKAFEELICNSYDASANRVSILLDEDLKNDSTILIVDNGEGMNVQELKELWHVGFSKKSENKKERKQIGKFGIGKLSTYILASDLIYLTKKDNRYLLTHMNYDLINNGNESIYLDEKELTEQQSREFLQTISEFSNSKIKFSLFGKDAEKTWTVAIMHRLKDKAFEIQKGRLKWILETALPISPQFKLYLNGNEIKSKKLSKPIIKEWIFGLEDDVVPKIKDCTVNKDENGNIFVNFNNLKNMYGKAVLFRDTLLDGKASELGRSHGIFLIIRGRLVNLDDPLLGMSAFSHGVFNRLRVEVYADELNEYLTSTRESIKDSEPLKELKDYLKKKIHGIANYYFSKEAEDENKADLKYRLSNAPQEISVIPMEQFIDKFYNGKIKSPFICIKPNENNREEILEKFKTEIDRFDDIIERISWEMMSADEPICRFDFYNRTLKINNMHPYALNYSENIKSRNFIESVASLEFFTELNLHKIDVEESKINSILSRRDDLYRALASSDKSSKFAVINQLKNNLSNPNGLENAVYQSLSYLGFTVTPIGGKGEPDGFAEAKFDWSGSAERYSFTYDTKSTAKDKIQAATGHLSGLKRHQQNYNATYTLLVAQSYEGQDKSDSAIVVETKQQKVTAIKIIDLIKLVVYSHVIKLNLRDLKEMFDTCYSPSEVETFISTLIEKNNNSSYKPPYKEIIEIAFELQESTHDVLTVEVITYKLNEKLKKSYKNEEMKKYIKNITDMSPKYVYLDGNIISLSQKPEIILTDISNLITEYTPEDTAIYSQIFDIK